MDFNNDGLKDLLAGDTEGNVWFFRNVGSAKAPRLAEGVKLEAGGKVITGRAAAGQAPEPGMGFYSKLHATDWDGDGLLDILIGQDMPTNVPSQIVLYRNVGTAKAPKLAAPVRLDILKQTLPRPSPYVVDWDGDGKRDMLLGMEMNQVMFLKNTGTNEKPEFAAPEKLPLEGLDKCYRCRITVTDWNNDGKLDLLVGTFYSGSGDTRGGNVWLFLRR